MNKQIQNYASGIWNQHEILPQVSFERYGTTGSGQHYLDSAKKNAKPIKAILALKLQEGETVVDIGCGPGNGFGFLRHIEDRRTGTPYGVGTSGRIIGIDPYEDLLVKARENGLADEIYAASAEDMSMIPDSSVDAALMAMALHWVPNHGAALGEVLRILKPGGRLAIRELCHDSHNGFNQVYATVMRRDPFSQYPLADPRFGQFDPERLADALVELGYSSAEVTNRKYSEVCFDGNGNPPSAILDQMSLFSGNLIVAHLPEGLRQRAIEELGAELDNNSPLQVRYGAFVLLGEK